jgi:hypothetical protein
MYFAPALNISKKYTYKQGRIRLREIPVKLEKGKIRRNLHSISSQKTGIWSSIEFLWSSIEILLTVLWNSMKTLWSLICQFSVENSNGDFYGIFL